MTNREKYMKEIYELIDSESLSNFVSLSKDGKIMKCDIIEHPKNCENCKFNKDDSCDFFSITKWLDSEAKED